MITGEDYYNKGISTGFAIVAEMIERKEAALLKELHKILMDMAKREAA